MNNREWINSLSNKKFMEYFNLQCNHCIYGDEEKCEIYRCTDGVIKWLEQEYENEN